MKKLIAIGLIGLVCSTGIYGMVFMWLPFILRENATPAEKWAHFGKHMWKVTWIGIVVATAVAWTGIGWIATIYHAVETISNLIVYWAVAPALIFKFVISGFSFKTNSNGMAQ